MWFWMRHYSFLTLTTVQAESAAKFLNRMSLCDSMTQTTLKMHRFWNVFEKCAHCPQSDSGHWIRIVIHLVNQFLPIEKFRCGFWFSRLDKCCSNKIRFIKQNFSSDSALTLSNSHDKFHRILTIEHFNRKKTCAFSLFEWMLKAPLSSYFRRNGIFMPFYSHSEIIPTFHISDRRHHFVGQMGPVEFKLLWICQLIIIIRVGQKFYAWNLVGK